MRYFWCELAIVSAFMITFAVEFNSLTIINLSLIHISYCLRLYREEPVNTK